MRVHLAARLLPDLGPGRLVVRLRVRLVRVLVGLEGAGDLLGEAVRDRVVALGRGRRDGGRADDDLGAVAAQERALLLGDLVRHDEHAAVALDRRGDGEARRPCSRSSAPRSSRPGLSFPSRSASSIIRSPIRSFTLPPGLMYSSLARSVGPSSLPTRCSRTSGVPPTRSRTVGYSRATAVAYSVPASAGSGAARRRPSRRPAASTAATTSASRFEPPGWTIAPMPASRASCGPSANGKKASDASAAPARSCPCSAAFSSARRTASTRLVWPPPMPMTCRSLAITMAFEATCFATRQAKRRSPQPGSSGCPVVTTCMPSRSSTSASVSWTRNPPSTRR